MVKRFAKYQKLPVRYKGIVYDPIPEVLRYRGAAYEVVAVEGQTPEDIERDKAIREALDLIRQQEAAGVEVSSDLKQLLADKIQEKKDSAAKTGKGLLPDEQKFLETVQQQSVEDLDPSMVDLEEDTPKEPEKPQLTPEQKARLEAEQLGQEQAEKFLQRKVTDEEIANAINWMAETVKASATEFVTSYGLDVREARLLAVEEDGLDVAAQVDTGNFKGDAFFVLDYGVTFPKNRKTQEVSEDAEEEPKFLQQLASGIYNVDKASHDKRPQEVILHICRHNFVPAMNDLDGFMKSMAFLQKGPVDARPGTLREIPKEDASEEKLKQWASAAIKKMATERFEREVGIQFSQGAKNWGDRKFFDEVLTEAVSQRVLTQQFVNKLQDTLDKLTGNDDEKFRDLVREALQEKHGEGVTAMDKTVKNAVQQLTKHEDYRGDVQYGVDENGDIVASIEAPYPFRFIFQRAGMNVRLKEAQMSFCDWRWVTKSPAGAVQLVSADLELAHAYKRAVNPSLSQSRKEMEQREMYKKVRRMLRREDVEQGVQSEEAVGLPKKDTGTK